MAPILRQPTWDFTSVLQNQDEINQIGVAAVDLQQQQKGSNERKGSGLNTPSQPSSLYLAAADDAGTVRLMDIDSKSSQVLHHDQNGVAVVTTFGFRPGVKALELASGGTDCKIHLWDVKKPR